MAVSPSTTGNIWTSSRTSRPIRRPRNRNRLNAKAAAAPIISAAPALTTAIVSVLRNQVANGHWLLVSRV